MATLHADHISDSSCFQAVVLCFIVAVAAHIRLVAAGTDQLAPAKNAQLCESYIYLGVGFTCESTVLQFIEGIALLKNVLDG